LAESDSAADSNAKSSTDSDKPKPDASVAKSEPVKSDIMRKKQRKRAKRILTSAKIQRVNLALRQ